MKEAFEQHGWVVVRGVVSHETVAALERAVDGIYTASPAPPPHCVWEVASGSQRSPEIRRHVHDAAIARLVATVLGAECVQLLQDTMLVKPARVGGEVAWHQDHTYTGYIVPARLASVRLALTPCTIERGCLEVIDGSHRWGQVGDVRALTESGVRDGLGDTEARWMDHVVAIELEPGDISIHHCFTFHRSARNRSPEVRKTIVTRLFDATCTLDTALLPPGAAATFPVDEAGRLSRTVFPIVGAGATARSRAPTGIVR